MKEERYNELLNGEIDGINSPEESRALREYLKHDQRAMELYRELCETLSIFSEAGEVDPPEDLRSRILSSVAEINGHADRRSILASFFGAFRTGTRRSFAYSFAAGILTGFVILAVIIRFVPVGGDFAKLVGTVSYRDGAEYRLEPIEITLPEVAGSISFICTKANIRAEFDITSSSEIRVVLDYAETTGFESFKALERCDHDMKVTGDRIELTHAGACSYTIILGDDHREKPPIGMKIYAEGGLLFEKTVSLARN
jgi:hypothetical protein